MGDPEVKININKEDEDPNVEQSAEAQVLAADSAKAQAEMAKLSVDLEELRQTLLRRQADFDNYRKRIEKERFEDSKRATIYFDSAVHQALRLRAAASDRSCRAGLRARKCARRCAWRWRP